MPPATATVAKPSQPKHLPDPPAAADEGKIPTPAENALIQEKVTNAQQPPIDAGFDNLLSSKAYTALGLTDAQKAKGEKVYIVKEAFELNWDNHRRIRFKQGTVRMPVAIFDHWYINPGKMVRVVEA